MKKAMAKYQTEGNVKSTKKAPKKSSPIIFNKYGETANKAMYRMTGADTTKNSYAYDKSGKMIKVKKMGGSTGMTKYQNKGIVDLGSGVDMLKSLKDQEKSGAKFYKTNIFGKTSRTTPEKYLKKYSKYSSKKGSSTSESDNYSYTGFGKKEPSSGKITTTSPRKGSTRSVAMYQPIQKKVGGSYKMGGMVKSKKK